MKKIIVAILMFAGTNVAMAQDAKKPKMSPEQRAEKQTDMMVRKLNLNDQQAQEVKVINMETAKEMRPMIEERKGNREKMKSILDNRDAKLQRVLTKEQWNTYDEVKQARMEKRHQMRKGGNK